MRWHIVTFYTCALLWGISLYAAEVDVTPLLRFQNDLLEIATYQEKKAVVLIDAEAQAMKNILIPSLIASIKDPAPGEVQLDYNVIRNALRGSWKVFDELLKHMPFPIPIRVDEKLSMTHPEVYRAFTRYFTQWRSGIQKLHGALLASQRFGTDSEMLRIVSQIIDSLVEIANKFNAEIGETAQQSLGSLVTTLNLPASGSD